MKDFFSDWFIPILVMILLAAGTFTVLVIIAGWITAQFPVLCP